ncbi:MAG: glycosyltransferase family 117 protein [Candidatus Nanoarchaeia archaeon]
MLKFDGQVLKSVGKKLSADLRKKSFFLIPLISSFILYFCTLAPTTYWDDSGEMITAAFTLGIPHPSGFPLFVLLGKLFSFIPLYTVAWRLNLMSALFSSLSVMLLSLITYRMTKDRFAGFAAGMVLAVLAVFWHYATVAEVYSLNMFLILLEIYLLLLWREKRKNFILYVAAGLFGLSLTTHPTSILLLPAFIYFVVVFNDICNKNNKDKKKFKDNKKSDKNKRTVSTSNFMLLVYCSLFTILGLLILFYLPIRSSVDPVLDWGNVETFSGLYNHLTAQLYQSFFVFDFRIIENLFNFLTKVMYQYGLYILFCVLGVYLFIKNKNKDDNKKENKNKHENNNETKSEKENKIKNNGKFLKDTNECGEHRHLFYFFALIFFTYLLFNITYNIEDIESYYLIIWAILSLCTGVGISYVSNLAKWQKIKLLLLVFLVLGLFLQSIFVYDNLNKRKDYSAKEYSYFVFDSLPENAVVLSNQGEYAPLFYFHFVEGVRPDIIITPMVCVKDEYCVLQLKKNNTVVLTDNFKDIISREDLERFREEMAPRKVYVLNILSPPMHYDNSSWSVMSLDELLTISK